MVTVECLQGISYSVVEADSVRAALALLERGDPFDLVVMDQGNARARRAGYSGLARRTRPGLKVLFISGYAGIAGNAREARHDGWLQKPFRGEVLVAGVSPALHHVNEGVWE